MSDWMPMGCGGLFNTLELTANPATTPQHGNVPDATVSLFQRPAFNPLDQSASTSLSDREVEEWFSTLGSYEAYMQSTCSSPTLLASHGHDSPRSNNNEPVPMVGAYCVQEGQLSMIWSASPVDSPQHAPESLGEVMVRDQQFTLSNLISDYNLQQQTEKSTKRPRKRTYVRSPLNARKATHCPHCNVTFLTPGALT